MKKEEILKSILNENEFKHNAYKFMHLNKRTIVAAYYLYNYVSHTKAKKYLALQYQFYVIGRRLKAAKTCRNILYYSNRRTQLLAQMDKLIGVENKYE